MLSDLAETLYLEFSHTHQVQGTQAVRNPKSKHSQLQKKHPNANFAHTRAMGKNYLYCDPPAQPDLWRRR